MRTHSGDKATSGWTGGNSLVRAVVGPALVLCCTALLLCCTTLFVSPARAFNPGSFLRLVDGGAGTDASQIWEVEPSPGPGGTLGGGIGTLDNLLDSEVQRLQRVEVIGRRENVTIPPAVSSLLTKVATPGPATAAESSARQVQVCVAAAAADLKKCNSTVNKTCAAVGATVIAAGGVACATLIPAVPVAAVCGISVAGMAGWQTAACVDTGADRCASGESYQIAACHSGNTAPGRYGPVRP
jgi:hypothetical protein